jgi:hypothetical protein
MSCQDSRAINPFARDDDYGETAEWLTAGEEDDIKFIKRCRSTADHGENRIGSCMIIETRPRWPKRDQTRQIHEQKGGEMQRGLG